MISPTGPAPVHQGGDQFRRQWQLAGHLPGACPVSSATPDSRAAVNAASAGRRSCSATAPHARARVIAVAS
jgi:hypothetical protein